MASPHVALTVLNIETIGITFTEQISQPQTHFGRNLA